MTEPTDRTVEELRAAATKLREAAEKATAGPWKASPVWSSRSHAKSAVYSHAHPTGTAASEVVASGLKDRAGGIVQPGNSVWIALVHPDLADPLADWLEEEARQYDLPPCDDPTGVCNRCEHNPGILDALRLARVINGGDQR